MLHLQAIPVLEGSPKLDGIHLQWQPTIGGHHAPNGFNIWRREASKRAERRCEILESTRLDQLHDFRRLDLNFGEIFFITDQPGWTEWSKLLAATLKLTDKKPPFPYELCLYHVRVPELTFGIEMLFNIHARNPFAYVLAMRAGKVVEVKTVLENIAFKLENAADELRVYLSSHAESIQICHDDRSKSINDGWKLVKKKLQMPFSQVNPAVPDADAGLNLAKSRLLAADDLGDGDFKKLTELANETFLEAKKSQLPVASVLAVTDSEPEEPDAAETTFFHFSPWNWLLSLTVRPAWRRALGFAWRDTDQNGVVPGQAYDYKITADFPQKALAERVLDFRSVPLHTRVGPGFALREVFLFTEDTAEITAFPASAEASGEAVYQKGVQVQSRLYLFFPQMVERVVLFCAAEFSGNIHLPVQNQTFSPAERLDLNLPGGVSELILEGNFALLGLSFPAVVPGDDPEKLTETAGHFFNVLYNNTPRLPTPAFLAAENLQTQWLPGTRQVPEGLGFRLRWELPTLAAGLLPPQLWPPNLPAPPPSEVNHFILEHWDKTAFPAPPNWRFYDFEEADHPEGMVVPYRGTAPALLSPVVFGADLLAIFPPEKSVAGRVFHFAAVFPRPAQPRTTDAD